MAFKLASAVVAKDVLVIHGLKYTVDLVSRWCANNGSWAMWFNMTGVVDKKPYILTMEPTSQVETA